jgi:hypothetical protein
MQADANCATRPTQEDARGALTRIPRLDSLEVRRVVAEEAARGSFDDVVKRLKRYTGAHVPKRQVEELAVRAAQDFDAFYAYGHNDPRPGIRRPGLCWVSPATEKV